MKMFVVAGEKSGDKQGALVMQELLRRRPDLEIVGLGGNRMHALAPGVEDWADAAAVIGIVEVLRHIRFFARKLKEKYPALEIGNIAPLVYNLRAIKTPEEIECLRRAGDVTMEALAAMLKSAKPGEYEYQWQADYEHYVARQGMRNAFTTIAASGHNAVMLHYHDNNCIVKEGDLLLLDLGAEYGYYSADVSRTFPISGKYSERQKELYNIVLEAMELAKDKMRPGVAIRESQQAVIDFYKKALRSAKLITEDSEVGKYYYHGVSHSLGLDTHDPHDRTVYEPGMVITCEPGLYVAEENIGIRLENDIVVTDGAPMDLIGDRLLKIEEIEALMAR